MTPMEILGTILIFIGIGSLLMIFVCSIWLVIYAFQRHVLWGLGSLFFPVVQIIFVIFNWERSRRPALIALVCAAVAFLAFMGADVVLPGEG